MEYLTFPAAGWPQKIILDVALTRAQALTYQMAKRFDDVLAIAAANHLLILKRSYKQLSTPFCFVLSTSTIELFKSSTRNIRENKSSNKIQI